MCQRITDWLNANPNYKLDIGITGIDERRKNSGVVLKSWDDILEDNWFSKDVTFGDRTDNVIKQIREHVKKLGGDVRRLNLHRGNLNAGTNTAPQLAVM